MHKKMENVSVLNYTGVLNESKNSMLSHKETITKRKTGFNPSIIKVINEGGENFFLYLKRHNFSKEENLLVLPSVHHFYYDQKELKGVRTLVNLKKLNHIKHLDGFLQTIFLLLPPEANFIGCFTNDKNMNKNGLTGYKASRLLSRFTNFIDSRIDRILDKGEVLEALERNGHKIVDMTEMDGLTYFYSKSTN
jgi:hypothetical protein